MYLFTYGTLRRGGGLNFKLHDVGEYVGSYKTLPKYTMYDMGCPIMSPNGETSITGDVYRVEDLGSIAPIHNMEVRAGYTLELVELFNFDEPVYAYFQSPEPGWDIPVIASGDWLNHRSLHHVYGI
jgi:gamma-glutamylcyclotransferase (GGCT)/AIG2-like uncharacterized protein YtfP